MSYLLLKATCICQNSNTTNKISSLAMKTHLCRSHHRSTCILSRRVQLLAIAAQTSSAPLFSHEGKTHLKCVSLVCFKGSLIMESHVVAWFPGGL